MFDRIVEDAKGRFVSAEIPVENIDIHSWDQTWGSTACDSGGMGGSMMTSAKTVIVVSWHPTCSACSACVYHGRFSYLIEDTSEEFWECVRNNRLPGRLEKKAFLRKNHA